MPRGAFLDPEGYIVFEIKMLMVVKAVLSERACEKTHTY